MVSVFTVDDIVKLTFTEELLVIVADAEPEESAIPLPSVDGYAAAVICTVPGGRFVNVAVEVLAVVGRATTWEASFVAPLITVMTTLFAAAGINRLPVGQATVTTAVPVPRPATADEPVPHAVIASPTEASRSPPPSRRNTWRRGIGAEPDLSLITMFLL
jgi:hypothetical protein